jgi:hypothetical protein
MLERKNKNRKIALKVCYKLVNFSWLYYRRFIIFSLETFPLGEKGFLSFSSHPHHKKSLTGKAGTGMNARGKCLVF